MQEFQILIEKLIVETAEINKKLEAYESARYFDDWIPRKKIMSFLNYEDTQFAELIKTGKLKATQVGNRKFIKKASLLKLLEDNIIVPPK